jgi:hypothetical protein
MTTGEGPVGSAPECRLTEAPGIEYDVRRPLTPTGTNLFGLVKHNAGMELM